MELTIGRTCVPADAERAVQAGVAGDYGGASAIPEVEGPLFPRLLSWRSAPLPSGELDGRRDMEPLLLRGAAEQPVQIFDRGQRPILVSAQRQRLAIIHRLAQSRAG